MKKNYFYLFSGVLIIIFILFVLRIFTTQAPNPTKTATPTIDTLNQVHPPSAQELKIINENSKKGDLINILPYTGTYFSFDFDFAKNSFVLTLDKNNITAGNNNFDTFLKNNGVPNRSWFNDLLIIYK
jgi:hypothetical protein